MVVGHLVLDAGPLLSLSPINNLAAHYYTVPEVVAELKDKQAREYLERLLLAGINVQVQSPSAADVTFVTQTSMKTGDYPVLSKADILVLALTYSLNRIHGEETPAPNASATIEPQQPLSHVEDSEDEGSENDDGGDWITPTNVGMHKSKALGLIPSGTGARTPNQQIAVGCMTADFAMQNVLLHMGLHLIDVRGYRINEVKNWLLRCHACFKLCKDMTKKFCPSCGNPSLLRTSVSIVAGDATSPPKVKVHLKKNFVYRTRGTIYPIPAPKPGSSKSGSGEGLILRADQKDWARSEKLQQNRMQREEKRIADSLLNQSKSGGLGSWMDPDWVPEMLTVGINGQGRRQAATNSMDVNGMPQIGYGRQNPNERRRKRK